VYPNLYVLLVATPGVGKSQAIKHVNDLWTAFPSALHVAPHDITKAALVDALAQASHRHVIGESQLVEYNSLLVAADEFGVLVPSHDLEFLSTLVRIYDNPAQHRQSRRGLQQQIDIVNPQLNIIGGVQPAYLANLLPEEAWGMGFMSRVIMVYSAQKIRIKLNLGSKIQILQNADHRKWIVLKLQEVLKKIGEIAWTDKANQMAEDWHAQGCPPEPSHSKLDHYNQRRIFNAVKLSIVSAISRNSSEIDAVDFNRARDWLLEAETLMPDVFKEMVQRSDFQALNELHIFAWQEWTSNGRKPIHEVKLINFLKSRAPVEKIPRLIGTAVAAKMFDSVGAGYYVPIAKHLHGMES
jgi:Protein of unknown function (DUF3987)